MWGRRKRNKRSYPLPGGPYVTWTLLIQTPSYEECIQFQQWAEKRWPLGLIYVELTYNDLWNVYVGKV